MKREIIIIHCTYAGQFLNRKTSKNLRLHSVITNIFGKMQSNNRCHVIKSATRLKTMLLSFLSFLYPSLFSYLSPFLFPSPTFSLPFSFFLPSFPPSLSLISLLYPLFLSQPSSSLLFITFTSYFMNKLGIHCKYSYWSHIHK